MFEYLGSYNYLHLFLITLEIYFKFYEIHFKSVIIYGHHDAETPFGLEGSWQKEWH